MGYPKPNMSNPAQRAAVMSKGPSVVRGGDVPGRALAVGGTLAKRTVGVGAVPHGAQPKLPKARVAGPAPIKSIPPMASAAPAPAARGIVGGAMKTGITPMGSITGGGGMPNVG